MKKVLNTGFTILLITIVASCGNTGRKENAGALGDKKVKLEELKNKKESLVEKITTLEEEIAKLDTNASMQAAKLVVLTTLEEMDFKHYLELQGKVDAQNISYITPKGQPGQIEAIYVKQGNRVRKGDLVLKLDNSVAMQNVNAAKQQLNSVKAQLDLAKSVYQRQKNLWDQQIGTEVQLLQAKTNVETLEGQLKSIQANVKIAQTVAGQSNVYSNVNGTIDEITAHVGETFNGNPLQGGYIKVVDKSDLKITVTIPETYAGKVTEGSPITVEIPDINKSFTGKISFISRAIGSTTRGFTAEVKVPSNLKLRPNQIAKVRILDYSVNGTITIPLNTLQTDENGKYVLVAAKEGDKLVARKRKVLIGELYNGRLEIKSGLQEGDQLITDGYLGLFDGQIISTSEK